MVEQTIESGKEDAIDVFGANHEARCGQEKDCRRGLSCAIRVFNRQEFDSIDPMTERQFGGVMIFKCLLILLSLLYATPAVHSWAAAAKFSFDEKAVADFTG
jgi:hypothetical protein